MITTILATLAAAQVQGPLPEKAAIVYSGIPGIVGPATSDVRMTGHSVTFDLTKSTATVTTLTLFHNDSTKPVALWLKFPVNAQNPVLGRGWDIDFKATMDKVPLKLSPWKAEQTFTDEAVEISRGVSWTKIIRYKGVATTFKPSATHALRVTYTVPMGKSGLDGMQRLIAYETSGALSWKGSVDRLNFSVRYDPSVVFQMILSEPKWGWQIGTKGGFFKQDNFRPEGDTLVRYIFYPGGYDKIGTSGY
jgi:hypothetical protein